MRAHYALFGLIALVACNGSGGDDTGATDYDFPTGCIATSAGGSFAMLGDAVVASPAGTTITLCPEAVLESVEVIGKELTITGVEGTEWRPPANEPALVLTEGAVVTVSGIPVFTTRNGVEVTDSTLTLERMSFDAPGNYAVEGTNSEVTIADVSVQSAGWGGVRLGGETAQLTATGLTVDSSTGNAVTLEQGASGTISESVFSFGLCTNDGSLCIEADGWGVEVKDGGALTSSDNTFEYNIFGGIRAESASIESTNDTLTGNIQGIFIENGSLVATGTTIVDSDQYGILGLTMDATLTNVTVSGDPDLSYYETNDEDTDGDGIDDENSVLEGTYGILGFDTALVGDGLAVSGNNGGGIYLAPRLDTSVSIDLRNSVIDNNAAYGVFAQLGEVTFTDVDITNTRRNAEFCEQVGIIQCDGGLWAAASDVTWTGGSVTGNGYIGYLGIQNNHTVEGVRFADNDVAGIRVDAGALGLTDSEVTGSGLVGVVISNGAVATIDGLDVHDRAHTTISEFSSGASSTNRLAAREFEISASTTTIRNSTFSRGQSGIYAFGADSSVTVEDSSFTDYNQYGLYTVQSSMEAARTSFANVGGSVLYCSSGSLSGQNLTIAGAPAYAVDSTYVSPEGVEQVSDYTVESPAVRGFSCTADLSGVQISETAERAMYFSGGSVQLDRVTVTDTGATNLTNEGAIHLYQVSDALLNDIDIQTVSAGHGLYTRGFDNTLTGQEDSVSSVRITELVIDNVAGGDGVFAEDMQDFRVSGISIGTTSGTGVTLQDSTSIIDGTALAAAGTITGAGADGVSVTGGTAQVSNLTVSAPAGAGILVSGGVDHGFTSATVESAGTYGMVCDTTPTFATCDTLALDGTSGVHLGCDECTTLAGL